MVLHVEEDVRVGVEGDAYGAVVKELPKRSWMNSSRKEQCSVGVAKVVEADVAQRKLKQQRRGLASQQSGSPYNVTHNGRSRHQGHQGRTSCARQRIADRHRRHIVPGCS